MFDIGSLLRVIVPIRNDLPAGLEVLCVEPKPRNPDLVRVQHPEAGPRLYRSNRFELVAPPVAPVEVPAAIIPAAPAPFVPKFRAGDHIRCLNDAGVEDEITQGDEYEVESDSRLGALMGVEWVQVWDDDGNIGQFKADRFELARVAGVQEPVVAPAAKVPGVFKVGDEVLIVKKVDVRRIGWSDDMDEYLNDGIARKIRRVDNAGKANESFKLDGINWNWPTASLQHAGEQPQAAPVDVKVGKVKPEDVVRGLRVRFVGKGTSAYLGNFVVGEVYVVAGKHFVKEAMNVVGPDSPNQACYIDNFEHVGVEQVGEIRRGSIVECLEGLTSKAGRQFNLIKGARYTVSQVKPNNLIRLEGYPGDYALRRFKIAVGVAAEPVPEAPNEPIPFEKVQKGMYVRFTHEMGLSERFDRYLNDGVYYQIASIDHTEGEETLTLEETGRYDDIPISVFTFYARKGANEAPKPAAKEKRTLKELFRMRTGGRYHGSLVSFATENEDGRQVVNLGHICYAPIRGVGPIQKLLIGAVPMLHQVKDQGKDAEANFRRYAEYIMKESPWAPCFITKSFDEALETGLEMDTDKTLSQAVGAAVALRQGHEYYQHVPTFLHFVDKGYSGNVAFLMSMCLTLYGKGWQRSTMGNNHECINSKGHKDAILSFFKNGFADFGDVPCKKNQNEYKLFKAIDPKNEGWSFDAGAKSFDRWAGEEIKSVEEGAGFKKVVKIDEQSVYAFADTLTKTLNKE